ncbi:hypothetical protein SCLCIDRAFT_1222534 [Scleroderma citrinum Foug A]|uniref:Uncharacterized protein n=1 Tax=Scleroderma citrinum Foug A TaxID=1036808 RepID=A0A0C2ZMH0_9AGAM|nr:hypothetical protein SCLCIDRAFT_1222534 [Scleroderma citrinum Foug A]
MSGGNTIIEEFQPQLAALLCWMQLSLVAAVSDPIAAHDSGTCCGNMRTSSVAWMHTLFVLVPRSFLIFYLHP